MAVKVSGTTVIDGSRNIINVGNVDGRDVSVDGAKLDGIAAGAEVNQNTFSSIVVAGQSDVVADAKTDAVTFVAGTGVSITTNATTDSVTFNTNIGTDVLAYDANLQSFVSAFTLPTVDGSTGQVLTTNGAGTLTFSTITGYTDADVDTHLNTGTAASGEVLSWTGTDYDWVSKGPSFTAIASGAISAGSPVSINSNGTVSESGTLVFADAVGPTNQLPDFSNGEPRQGIAYDSANNKGIIVYRNSSSARAVVFSVSGETILAGSPVTFGTATNTTNPMQVVYDELNQKIVVLYRSGFSSYEIKVGEISGDSVSFGTSVFVTISADEQSFNLFYEPVAQKVIFVRRAISTSEASVGTVSGNTISFGTTVSFDGRGDFYQLAYDTTNNKVVIAYQDDDNSGFSTVIVGTVSGDTISFGTPVVFRSSLSTDQKICYVADQEKFLLYGGGPFYLATVSGSSITVGSQLSIGANLSSIVTNLIYDPAAKKVLILYRDNNSQVVLRLGTVSGDLMTVSSETYLGGNIGVGVYHSEQSCAILLTSTVMLVRTFRAGYTDINYGRFVGFSAETSLNGETTVVNVVGAVAQGQIGLSTAQKYYVQEDGSLATTPDTIDIYAGVALSSDKILIKG